MEYSCEVWDNCTVADAARLEKVQVEAARIVTGLTVYASNSSVYLETGWDKLAVRRERRKLCIFYNIVTGSAPDYLQDLLPGTVGQGNNYNLRNARDYNLPRGRLCVYRNSFFPHTIRLWNNLPNSIRDLPTIESFKYNLKTSYYPSKKPPPHFNVGSRLGNILHTRLRRRSSSLKCDLFRCNLIDTCYCDCGKFIESADHYFLVCSLYTAHRNVLFIGMRELDIEITIENILFGNIDFDYEKNSRLFLLVQKFILDSKRFVRNDT